jgi:hypothetical protein
MLANGIIAQQRLAAVLEADRFHQLRNAFLVGAHDSQTPHSPLAAVSICEVPRMDVSLADLLEKTGVVPEGIIGAMALLLLPSLRLLHTVCRCVHNDIDARNVFVCCSSGLPLSASSCFSRARARALTGARSLYLCRSLIIYVALSLFLSFSLSVLPSLSHQHARTR